MRDVRNSTSTEVFVDKETYKLFGSSYDNIRSSDPVTFSSARSDITVTQPIHGEYALPTAYEAHFRTGIAEPGSGFWEDFQYSHLLTWTGPGFSGRRSDLLWYGATSVGSSSPEISWALWNQALARAMDKVRDTDWSPATTAGEAREVVRMMSNLVQNAAKLLKGPQAAARRGDTKGLADIWLGLQYGILPLMRDCFALAIYLNHELVPNVAFTVKAVTMDGGFSVPQPEGSHERIEGECTRGVEVSYTFRITDPTRYELWRLGLTNPASLVWELTTLSFVVDWFTGFGDMLRGLSRPLGMSFEHGYATKFLRSSFSWELRQHPPHAENVKGCWTKVHFRAKAMARVPLVTFERPLPYISLGLDIRQALSAVALMRARS